MTSKDMLQRLIDHFSNGNKSHFAKMIGVKPQTISTWIARDSMDKDLIFAKCENISPSWLMSGEGEMLSTPLSSTSKADALESSPDFSPQNLVPLVPIAAQGGSLSEFADSSMAYDCEKVISPIKDVDMAICVSGDSMAPEYPPGCQILVKKINERAFIDWGRVYVLDTVNGAVIKKVLPADSPDTVLCVSINPDYPPFEVHMEHINGFYRVMMMMSLK